jgi:uncharacterized membrane protein YfcA
MELTSIIREFLWLKCKEISFAAGGLLLTSCVIAVIFGLSFFLVWAADYTVTYVFICLVLCALLGCVLLLLIDWIRENWEEAKKIVRKNET